jgi:hypothetical protein
MVFSLCLWPTTKLRTTKNTRQTLVILIPMGMRWYDAGRITRWSTSRASLEATVCHPLAGECLHCIAVEAAMVDEIVAKHITITKHNLLTSNYCTFYSKTE